jgi:DNA-directed RNA polymerase specialized sigma24 family protein
MNETETDYLDPARNLKSATGRISFALDAIEDTEATTITGRPTEVEALEHLEKAHYRLERAQRALVEQLRGRGTSWDEIADAVQMEPRAARKRFTESAWLGRS